MKFMAVFKNTLSLWLIMIFIFSPFLVWSAEKTRSQIDQEIKTLNTQIQEQKAKIEQIQKRIQLYARNVEEFRNQTLNLKTELGILENKIAENQQEVEKTSAEIEAQNLKIQLVTLTILDREREIQEKKSVIAEFVRKLDKLKRRDTVAVLASHEHFSDFYAELQNVQDIQLGIQQNLKSIKAAKTELVSKKDDLEVSQNMLLTLFDDLENKRLVLEQQKSYKNNLIVSTKQSEKKYQDLLSQARQDQLAVDSEITKLDASVRSKMKQLNSLGPSGQGFIWPIQPNKGISAYFHDPTYPYRKLFEHPAIDIPAPQGTVIRAARGGYVARVRSPQEVGKGYSFIMIVHADGLSTVYGHLSCTKVVAEDMVRQGDTIGCVGGQPGTAGAGPLTSGSHLHFEVRKDGIPVDPIKYLP